MLNVSKRTMQRMRTDHRIEYVVVRGSCRYRLSEIAAADWSDNTVRNEEADNRHRCCHATTRCARAANQKEGGHRSWNCSHETTSRAGCRS